MRNWESVEIAKAMNVAEGGMAPELIQGRLAMLGWLGVVFAEKVTGQPAVEQVRRCTHPALRLRTTLLVPVCVSVRERECACVCVSHTALPLPLHAPPCLC